MDFLQIKKSAACLLAACTMDLTLAPTALAMQRQAQPANDPAEAVNYCLHVLQRQNATDEYIASTAAALQALVTRTPREVLRKSAAITAAIQKLLAKRELPAGAARALINLGYWIIQKKIIDQRAVSGPLISLCYDARTLDELLRSVFSSNDPSRSQKLFQLTTRMENLFLTYCPNSPAARLVLACAARPRYFPSLAAGLEPQLPPEKATSLLVLLARLLQWTPRSTWLHLKPVFHATVMRYSSVHQNSSPVSTAVSDFLDFLSLEDDKES